jgi:hypothetical protein
MTSAVGLDGDADHSDAIDPLDVDGGKALQKKDNLALNLLSRMFGGGAKSKPAVSSKSSPAKKAALKRLIGKSPNYSSHRGRATASKAAAGIPPIPPPPHIMGALPGQGGPLAGPGGGDGPNPVQMGLQEIIMGWTGAGWWSPCTEVCTGGRTRAEMKVEETFKQFQACEANCRKVSLDSHQPAEDSSPMSTSTLTRLRRAGSPSRRNSRKSLPECATR